MKRENKLWGILCALGLVFLLTGCTPKQLTEDEIVGKLPEDITQVTVDDEVLQMEITSFEVEKRKMDKDTNTDSVWGIVTLSNEYYEFKKYVTLTYSYYDVKGGWILDKYKEDNARMEYSVKKNPINESEVLEKPGAVLYDLELKDCKEDLVNNLIVYTCEAFLEAEYYTENWLKTVTYSFDGHRWNREEQIGEKNIEWNIIGEYYITTEEYGCDFYMNITDFDAVNRKVSGTCSFVYDYRAAFMHETASYDLSEKEIAINGGELTILLDNVGKYGQTDIYFNRDGAIATYDMYWKCRIGRKTSDGNSAESSTGIPNGGVGTEDYSWYVPSDAIPVSRSDYKNIAIFGVDSTNGALLKATRSNINMILSINKTTGDIRIVNVSYAAYMSIDDSYSKMHNIYVNGGVNNAIVTLNSNLDMDIANFVTVNADALIELIDGIGGIWVDVDEETLTSINNYQIYYSDYMRENWENIENTGFQQINGVQAAAYCLMKPENSASGWLWLERQQDTFMAIVEQMKAMDENELDLLIQSLSNKVYTSFDEAELMELKDTLVDSTLTGMELFPQKDTSVPVLLGSKGECLCPSTLEECVKQLHAFLFGESDYIPSDKVKEISAQIEADIAPYLNKNNP